MTVLLNAEPLCLDDMTSETTVAEVIDMARARLHGSGSVIIGLRHANEDITAERLETMLPQPASRFDGLELIADRPTRVVLEALNELRRAFLDTFAGVQDAADALRAGRIPEAMTTLMQCVAIWGQTQLGVVQSGQLAGIDFGTLRILDRPVAAWLEELASKLREIKEALEAQDHVLLGDILRYELDETLQDWATMLDGFIARIEEMDAAT